MSYCTGFVLGNVLMGMTYLVFKNKMNDDDNHDEQPITSTQAAQNIMADDTNSSISEKTNCNTIDNNTPEISIRYENILTATAYYANYANLLNNNNNELQEESIEYELTDYMLQNDIETIHSMTSSLWSSRSSIDAPSYSQQEDTTNNNIDLQMSYSQESVYNNFDDLFEIRDSWMTNNTFSGSISLDTDTIIVGLDGGGEEGRDDNDGSESEIEGTVSKEIKVDTGIKDKPNAMPTAGEEGEEGAEILKKLVIKCLVRNNCKGGLAKGKSSPRIVRSSGGEKEKIFPSFPKDPSLEENSNRDPNGRQDPPSAEETSQKYQEQMYEQQQHQQGSGRVGGGMSVSSINSNKYPPRPDIVRYNNNMVVIQNKKQPQYKQKPPRPDLISCNASSVPLSSCHSSYSCSTHVQQLSPIANPSLPGVVELSQVIKEGGVGSSYVIGQGELRRQHYKELLRQQRQKESMQVMASPLGIDSTIIPTKVPTLV